MAKISPTKLEQSTSVRRSNETIAVLPKTGRITLLTRRVFNIMLHFSQQDGIKDVYRRPLGEIMSNTDFGSKNTKIIKEHLRLLRGIEVEWNSNSEEEKRWGISGMIAEAEIIETPGIGTFIEWSLPPKIRDRLLDPAYYTKLSLQIHCSLRTGASVALYEICARYATNPSGVTNRAPWEWWRPRITGSLETEAKPEYKYFKRDILKPSIAQINALSDFQIELIEHKNGKWVEEIQFAITQPKQQKLDVVSVEPIDGALLEKLLRIGLSQTDAQSYFVAHDPQFIKATIEMLDKRVANQKLTPLNSKAAWFKSAIEKKYVDSSELVAIPIASEVNDKPTKRDQLIAEFASHRQQEALRYFKELNLDEQEKNLAECFTAEVGVTVKSEYRRKGLSSKLAETTFATWLVNKLWGEPTTEELLEYSMR